MLHHFELRVRALGFAFDRVRPALHATSMFAADLAFRQYWHYALPYGFIMSHSFTTAYASRV